MYRKFQFLAEPVAEALPESRERTAAWLTRRDTDFQVIPMTHPEHVRMRPDGTLDDGYRFTVDAFRECCDGLVPGLHALLCNLSGLTPRSDVPRSHYSIPAAVRIFNTVVSLRFFYPQGLCRRNLVYDRRYRVVDGVPGRKYELIPGSELFGSLLTKFPPDAYMGGMACGRYLELLFQHNAAGNVVGPHAGRWAWRVSRVLSGGSRLVLTLGLHFSSGGFAAYRQWACGKQAAPETMIRRLLALVGKARAEAAVLPPVADWDARMNQPLPAAERLRNLIIEIFHKSIPVTLIDAVWHETLQSGRDTVVLSLVRALLYTASQCPLGWRRRIETVVWRILSGQISFEQDGENG